MCCVRLHNLRVCAAVTVVAVVCVALAVLARASPKAECHGWRLLLRVHTWRRTERGGNANKRTTDECTCVFADSECDGQRDASSGDRILSDLAGNGDVRADNTFEFRDGVALVRSTKLARATGALAAARPTRQARPWRSGAVARASAATAIGFGPFCQDLGPDLDLPKALIPILIELKVD